MNHEGSTFLCGIAPFVDLIYFAKEADHLIEENVENSSFFLMDVEEWSKYDFAAAWSAISMATVKPPKGDRVVVAVSPRGAFWEADSSAEEETDGQIAGVSQPIRGLTAVADVIYAYGMGRSVLRRKKVGDWDEIGPGVQKSEKGVIGFESVDGFSEKDVYAVGWQGEIWNFKNRKWRCLDSPVSSNLNAVCCADDGVVYAVGDEGVMLKGRDDVWEVIETGRDENLMDVADHDGTVYVVTDFEILKLDGDSLVAEEEFADAEDLPGTCLHLLSAEDGIVSLGTKDLFRLSSGVWERLV